MFTIIAWLRRTRSDPPTDEEIQYNLLMESKKKQFNQKNKTSEIEVKSNPITNFPVYPEYDEKIHNKDNK